MMDAYAFAIFSRAPAQVPPLTIFDKNLIEFFSKVATLSLPFNILKKLFAFAWLRSKHHFLLVSIA